MRWLHRYTLASLEPRALRTPPLTGVDTAPFVVEVKGGPGTGKPRCDLGGLFEAEGMGREYRAERSDVS